MRFIFPILYGVSHWSANKHHLSDVMFGATLGYVVGHAYSRHHKQTHSEQSFYFIPFFNDRTDFGLILSKKF